MTQYANQQPPGFKNRIEKVAVVGASGRVGTFIVSALLETNTFSVTAITRSTSSSNTNTHTFPPSVHVKEVSYSDQSSLIAALHGQDALIITLSTRAPPDQQTKLIEAAAAANVAWILPNEWGYDKAHPGLYADIPLGEKHAAYTALVEKLGKSSWIGVTCGFWYEWSLGGGPYCYGFDIPKREVTFFDDGKTRVNTSTWSQVGRAVAGLLGLKVLPEGEGDDDDGGACLARYRDRNVYVSSFDVCQRDMWESVMRVTGTGVEEWKIGYESSVERYRRGVEEMRKGEMRGFAQLMYTRVFFQDGSGEFEKSRGLLNEVLGLPEEDMDEFTRIAVERSKSPII